MKPTKSPAFTLIELLVVVTIIVVLLSLLVPALDKAVYQAELAVCGANLHAIGAGALAYAVESNRRYPYRAAIPGQSWRPNQVSNGEDHVNGAVDDRLVLRDHINLDAMVDALVPRIDVNDTHPDSKVWVSYYLWFGWKFNTSGVNEGGMFRMGDRFSYLGERFSVLASDQDLLNAQDGLAVGSHPDRDGMMSPQFFQDQPTTPGTPDIVAGTAGIKVVFSRWNLTTTSRRSPIDMNIAYSDGAVSRYNSVKFDDRRMSQVPEWNNDNSSRRVWRAQLPIE